MKLTRRKFNTLVTAAAAAPLGAAEPVRKLRKDCYFGLHFDLHPGPEDMALGRDVNDALVQHILDRAHPDFVQYDSKGHPGWLGWPSKVGPSAPHIVNDSLAIWRRVTAKNGVSLFIHFSGIWDGQSVERHLEWARLDAERKPDGRTMSTSSRYADEILIPQLREAVTNYDLDGAWVDGECWAVQPDYSAPALAAWRKASGRENAPKDKLDPAWSEFLEFNREQFRKYVRHYATQLHESNPKFQIASNWLYSTFVPEKPELPVDYLSGDFLGNASISAARLEARYFHQTGRTWDMMAWGFHDAGANGVGEIHKPAVQVEQEASVVLAQGGGFQVYYVPTRQGFFEESHIETMAKISEFCRARQKWSHRTATVPQIGVVFSKETLYQTSGRLFGSWGKHVDPARGWVDALVACQYSVDVIPDWKLEPEVLRGYRMLVLPDWSAVGSEAKQRLLAWAGEGGRLVISGAENTALFADELGLKLTGKAAKQQCFLAGSEVLANVAGVWQDLEPVGKVLEKRYEEVDSTRESKVAAVAVARGKGEVAVIGGPIGRIYAATHAPAVRDFVRRMVGPRFEPLVRVSGPPTVEVVLRRRERTLLVHLLNSTGMQVAGDFSAVDYIPPVGPLELTFRGEGKPSLRVQPGGRELELDHTEKGWRATLERIELHAIIEAEGVLT
jgi:hypothetical protein